MPRIHKNNYSIFTKPELFGSITKLKQCHGYYFQIQGQMGITKNSKSIFFVYTHHGYFMQRIDFDIELWDQMIIKFNYFGQSTLLLKF